MANHWPQALPVDQEAVSSLLSTLASLNSERLVDDKASDLSQYDLSDPGLQIEVTTKGSTQKLLIGGQTITGGSNFAALAGDPRVPIANFNKSSLDKTAGDLRDKRLLTADFDKVSQIELLQQSAGKKEDITFARDKESWQILKPKPYRAESFKVDDLVRALKDAKMEISSSDDGTKIAAAFNGASPFVTAKISGASGTQELQIRKAKDDYYAKSSSSLAHSKFPRHLAARLTNPSTISATRSYSSSATKNPTRSRFTTARKPISSHIQVRTGGERTARNSTPTPCKRCWTNCAIFPQQSSPIRVSPRRLSKSRLLPIRTSARKKYPSPNPGILTLPNGKMTGLMS